MPFWNASALEVYASLWTFNSPLAFFHLDFMWNPVITQGEWLWEKRAHDFSLDHHNLGFHLLFFKISDIFSGCSVQILMLLLLLSQNILTILTLPKNFYCASLLSINMANMINILEKLVTGTMTWFWRIFLDPAVSKLFSVTIIYTRSIFCSSSKKCFGIVNFLDGRWRISVLYTQFLIKKSPVISYSVQFRNCCELSHAVLDLDMFSSLIFIFCVHSPAW